MVLMSPPLALSLTNPIGRLLDSFRRQFMVSCYGEVIWRASDEIYLGCRVEMSACEPIDGYLTHIGLFVDSVPFFTFLMYMCSKTFIVMHFSANIW